MPYTQFINNKKNRTKNFLYSYMFKTLRVRSSSPFNRGQGIVRPIAKPSFKGFFKTGDWGLVDFRTSVVVTRGGRWVRNCVCERDAIRHGESKRGFETGETISWI